MENQNSCAFVGQIHMINNIPGCDNIQHARINDWGTIVKKDAYKIGDLVGVAIVDAILPNEMVERLNIKSYLRKGNRVRTVKLKGVYSECLVFDIDENYKEGQDLMTDFNIVKYEEPERNVVFSQPKVYFVWNRIYELSMWRRWINYNINKFRKKYSYKSNPNFNIYYKFPNFKNVPDIFTENDDIVITRKIHGSNFRCGIVKRSKLKFWSKQQYEFVYGSHRVEKGSDSQGFYSTDIWKEMVDKYDLKDKMLNLASLYQNQLESGIILYGEVYGEGVQGEYNYNLKDRQLACFDIELNGEFVEDDIFNVLCKRVNIPQVKYLYEGKWSKSVQDRFVDANIEGTKLPEEGIVVKAVSGNKRLRAKVINPAYHIYAEKNNIPDGH